MNSPTPPSIRMRFDRRELAGSLGDLGVLAPLAIALVALNGLDATAITLTVGLHYLISGVYFRVPMPVQPMKVIAAYAIARALTPAQICTAGMAMGLLLLALAATGAMGLAHRVVPKPVIRGVQLSTGVLLVIGGLKFILGQSALQLSRGSAEPALSVAALGPVPIGIVLGVGAVVATLALLDNRRLPAGLAVVAGGAGLGYALGAHNHLPMPEMGFHLPSVLPFGLPQTADLAIAIFGLALPQIPMTVGNAVVAQVDLSRQYFGDQARRVTATTLATSMGIANILCALIGGMPVCHGAGGLSAHYRFGARTPGSNVMIGGLFLVAGLLLGDQAAVLLSVLPFSVLGALLVFSGLQLGLTLLDVRERRDLFVVLVMLGVALTTQLAIAFGVGLVTAYALRHRWLDV